MKKQNILQFNLVQKINEPKKNNCFVLSKPYYNCTDLPLLSFEFNQFENIISGITHSISNEIVPKLKTIEPVPKLKTIEPAPKLKTIEPVPKLKTIEPVPKLKTTYTKKRKRTKEEIKEKKRVSASESRKRKNQNFQLLNKDLEKLECENKVLKSILKIYNIPYDTKN